MVEIPVEKKGGSWWIWALLVALLAAALIWWATDDDEAERAALAPAPAAESAASVEPAGEAGSAGAAAGLPEPVAQSGDKSVAAILGNPAAFVGQSFSGQVRVAGVPTDRAFWIEDQGARLLTVLIDAPREVPMDIEAGQQLQIAEGTLRDASYISNLEGKSLDQDTLRLIRDQQIFLTANDSAIRK